jgi:hypothetical protein
MLNFTVTFESEEDPSASTDTPLGPFRSAALVAALQIAAASTLAKIFQNQIIASSDVDGRLSECACVENGVAMAGLLGTAVKSLLRLIEHKDRHIKIAALKCIVMFPRLLVDIQRCRGVDQSELAAFCGALSGGVNEIITVMLSMLHRDRIADADALRIVLDCVVIHGGQGASRKAQVGVARIAHYYYYYYKSLICMVSYESRCCSSLK